MANDGANDTENPRRPPDPDSGGGPVPRSRLVRELRELGLEPGDVVMVHCRMSALGHVVGAPLVPVGQPVRPMVHGATPPTADLPQRAVELVAARFDTVAAVAEGCDALVATGVMPAGVWL